MTAMSSPSHPSAKLRRMPMSEALKAKLEALRVRKLDNWHGPVELLEDWSVIILFCFLAQLAWGWQADANHRDLLQAGGSTVMHPTHPLLPLLPELWQWALIGGAGWIYWIVAVLRCAIGWSAYLLATLVVGARQHALAELHHQCSHHSFACHPRINYLGTILGGWPVLQSYSVYFESHVKNHHPKLGDPVHDPDYAGLIEAKVYGEHRSPKRVVEYLWSLLTPRSCFNYLKYLCINRMFAEGEDPRERKQRFVLYLAIIALCVAFPSTVGFCVFWYWVVPMCTTGCWVGAFVELAEHYPYLETTDPETRTEADLSRNRIRCSKLLDFFVGVHQDGLHLVHHVLPRMPQWACAEAHEILMAESEEYRNSPGAEVIGWSTIIQQMLSDEPTRVPWAGAATLPTHDTRKE